MPSVPHHTAGPKVEPGEQPHALLLRVEGLQVAFRKDWGRQLPVIDTANLTVRPDEAVGIVGESGSGKTMLCRSIIGTLRRRDAVITGGRIVFNGRDLTHAPEGVWREIRGKKIGYIPQSSLAGLNPVLNVETQLTEAVTAAQPMSHESARREALRLLDLVRIPRVEAVLKERSHELSGGMRQRVMIAAALSQKPKLLVADEPTTALDVTVQREILSLISRLRKELSMALILVTHDLSVVEEVCDSVMVMYAGATVEAGPLDAVVNAPRFPYSRALRASRIDRAAPGQDIEAIGGEPPTLGAWPSGCRFWPRCALGDGACRKGTHLALKPIARQLSACIYAERMDPHD